jgi:hypothetical protein
MPENAAPEPANAVPANPAPAGPAPAGPAPGEMSFYAAMLGEAARPAIEAGRLVTEPGRPPGEAGRQLGEAGRPLGWLLEGMITAQVTTVLARLGVADELAGGPLTAGQLAARVGAAPDPLSRLLSAAAVYGLVRKDERGGTC